MIVGILLAAGAARRFGGNKLLAEFDHGHSVAEVSCQHLRPAVDRLIAVVRPGDAALAACLRAAGATVCECVNADQGMGVSLAFGVRQAAEAEGWLIALADMPLVAESDIQRVATALREGAAIAVPVAGDRHGHPVGFSRRYFEALSALEGKHGARALLRQHAEAITPVPVSDASSWLDIDTPDDLAKIRPQRP